MKKKWMLLVLLACGLVQVAQAQSGLCYENKFARPLGEMLQEISTRFGVRLKYNDIDTTGLMLNYADSRIRPYSVEETLGNVLAPFDFKFIKQSDKYYKIKPYEYARRTDADGEKMIAYLNTLYSDKDAFETRKSAVKKEVRELLGIDVLLAQCVDFTKKPAKGALQPVILSGIRKFDGYSVQNIALETLPGLYVTGSIYAPSKGGKHPVIISPNGHFNDGRYREDQQQRLGVLARMGVVCIDYDLIGWGESVLQLGVKSHWTSAAHVLQVLNGIRLLDYAFTRKDVDKTRIGVCGGSGGGTQTILLTILDERYTAACPVVSLSSHFDGGCACESGLPITQAEGGSCNAEFAAMFAPKPLRVVSDGKDWTSTVPTLEYPYLQRIYGFYGATDKIDNVHLSAEGHDFGINKRNAVYGFFAKAFNLDTSLQDESKITIEPYDALYSFGKKGELLLPNAVRSFSGIEKYFPQGRYKDLEKK